MVKHILGALAGAVSGALAGYGVAWTRSKGQRNDTDAFVAAGALIGGVLGFGIPLLFYRSARSIPGIRAAAASGSTRLAQQYIDLINGRLNGLLREIGWKVETIRAEGDLVLLRLKADRGKRVADLQRIFPSDQPGLVQIRNGNAPDDLVRVLYRVEKIVFPRMGIRTLKLKTPPPAEEDRYRHAIALFRHFFGNTSAEGDFVIANL